MSRRGHRQQLKGGREYDWVGRWRRFYHWGSGVGKYVKSRMSRRSRRLAKAEARRQDT